LLIFLVFKKAALAKARSPKKLCVDGGGFFCGHKIGMLKISENKKIKSGRIGEQNNNSKQNKNYNNKLCGGSGNYARY
jgi:hypothetical protein